MKGTINRFVSGFLSLLLLISCKSTSASPPISDYHLVEAFPNLTFEQPLFLTHPPDGTDRLFVVEQAGRIYWFNNQAQINGKNLAVDISDRVRRENMEEGLLGFAFHPNLTTHRFVYLNYSASQPRRNVISRFQMNPDLTKILPESEKIILEVEQPYGNHNGGMLAFGPDGYLYIAMGDGGSAGDPHDNAQNKNVLLGKILRIDVDKKSLLRNYGIPEENPFVGMENARPEIWALGLRNPWRFSFDRKTGVLWAGDVGQISWEEIDIIKKGGNYGWNRWEGSHPYNEKLSDNGPYIEPVLDLGRDVAQSITGGYVYRGEKWKDLIGTYIFGDFVTGNIWFLNTRFVNAGPKLSLKGSLISSFGEDLKGELYFTSYDGKIYTFEKRRF